MAFLNRFLIRLKTTSVYKELLGNIHLVAIALILFLISWNFPFLYIFLVFYLYLLATRSRIIAKISILFVLLCFCSIQCIDTFITSKEEHKGTVINIVVYPSTQRLILHNGVSKIVVYVDNHQHVRLGDKVIVKGESVPLKSQRVHLGYHEKQALFAKGIHYKLYANYMLVNRPEIHIFRVQEAFIQYLEKNYTVEEQVFIKAMLLGHSYLLEEEMQSALSRSGIMHLFAVSGLHIQIFIMMLQKLLSILGCSTKRGTYFICGFLMIYLVITGFAASILRASLMYVSYLIIKQTNLKLSSIDLLSIIFIIWTCLNPYAIYHLGFVLSFSSTAIILLCSGIIKTKNRHLQTLLLTVFLLVLGLPFVSRFQGGFNVYTPIYNVIFIPIVSQFILPFSILVLVFPIFGKLYHNIIQYFFTFLNTIDNVLFLKVPVKRFDSIDIILYYGSIFLGLFFYTKKQYKKQFIGILLFLVCYVSISGVFGLRGSITFLDLDNGEAIIIQEPMNQCNMVIDTGDGKNKVLTQYLYTHKIYRLDILVLTHDHLDHNGEARDLISTFRITSVVTHAFDQNDYLINTQRLQEGDQFTCGKLVFFVLGPNKQHSDENDNSLILYTRIGVHNFLFLGDATKQEEIRIANTYNVKVDIIKIGHHGSKTSTSEEMIQKFRPQYAFICTGRVSKFGFPHDEVISTLQNYQVNIYRTDLHFSFRYTYYQQKKYKITYLGVE